MSNLLNYVKYKYTNEQGKYFIYGLRDKNAENHFREINITTHPFAKPLVLVLGGDGTTNTRRANGNGKCVENMLGFLTEKCDLMVVSYENGLTKDNIDKNITLLVDNIFLPILADYPEDSVPKLMRNITIVAHCAGASTVLSRIEKKIVEYMHNLDYSEQRIADALSQVVCITHAAIYPQDRELHYFTEFNCISSDDEVWIEAPSTWMDLAKRLQNDNSIQINPQDRQQLLNLYTNDLAHFPTAFVEDKDRCYLYKDNSHRACFVTTKLTTDETDHSLLSYDNNNLTTAGSCVLQAYNTIARTSVMNSVANKGIEGFVFFPFDHVVANCEHIFQQTEEQIKE